ncbi:hypothetical protein [Kibdelosporangium philippinense]|uniref:hypothetical protein n=1 Tax=Kibdelosporangium philippinense TaxID=211113 RepID=UPI00360E8049
MRTERDLTNLTWLSRRQILGDGPASVCQARGRVWTVAFRAVIGFAEYQVSRRTVAVRSDVADHDG